MTTELLTYAGHETVIELDDYPAEELTTSEPSTGLPRWVEVCLKDSLHLLELEAGWDSYGGYPISHQVFLYAFSLLGTLGLSLPDDIPQPSVIPTSLGGLAFAWTTERGNVEIEVSRPNRGELYVESPHGGEEIEMEFDDPRFPLEFLKQVVLGSG